MRLGLWKSVRHWKGLRQSSHQLPSQEQTFSTRVLWHGLTDTDCRLGKASVRPGTKDPAGRAGLKPVLQGSTHIPEKGPWMGQLRFLVRLWRVQTLPMAHALTHLTAPLLSPLNPCLLTRTMYSPSPSHAILQLQRPSTRPSLSPASSGSMVASWLCGEGVKRRLVFPACFSIVQPLCPEQHYRENPTSSCS